MVDRAGVSFAPWLVSVRDNYVELDNARFGIAFQNIDFTDALENAIDVTGTGINKHGLYLLNLNNHRSGCNTITQTTPDQNIGINARAVPNAVIGCNHTFDFNRDIQLAGLCGGLQFIGNEMNDGNFGLFVSGPSTVIGNQIDRGNKWIGTFNNNGARLQGAPLPPNRFFVESPQIQPLWPSSFFPAIGWFNIGNCSECAFDCEDIPQWVCDDGSNRTYRTLITLLDTMVVDGDSLCSEFVVETIRQARRQLYEDLLANPDLVQSSGLIEDFFENHSDSVYAQFAIIRHAIISIRDNNEALYNSIEVLILGRDSLVKLIGTNDSVFWSGISGNDSLDLLAENEYFRDMILELDEEIEPLFAEWEDSLFAVIPYMSSMNEQLESSCTYSCEVNEYQVNGISFDLLLQMRDTLSATEISTLENIIFQCPSSGGKAVYEARALYAYFVNDTIEFDDDSLCVPPSRLMGPIEDHGDEDSTYCHVFPSPANNILSIDYNFGERTGLLKVVLLDITGRSVVTIPLKEISGKVNLDISLIRDGLYLVFIASDNTNIYQSKVLIAH
jgi:hypothetical protein